MEEILLFPLRPSSPFPKLPSLSQNAPTPPPPPPPPRPGFVATLSASKAKLRAPIRPIPKIPPSSFEEKLLFLDSLGVDLAAAGGAAAAAAALLGVGLAPGELRRCAGACPEILAAAPGAIVAAAAFLRREAGVPAAALPRVVRRRPRLLVSSVPGRLRPTLYFHQTLDVLPLMNGVIGLPSWSTRFVSKMRINPPLLSSTRRIPTYCSASHYSTLTPSSSIPSTNKKKDKVIVVSGPTGAGKSRLALELAKRLNGEIISADSVQVYRGLDVGSAKPSIEERTEVPHHLINILHPSEDYSSGQFFEDARKATNCVIEKGRVPVVAGGTGLYLRWYIYGKPDVPKASLEITNEVWSGLVDLQKKGLWDAAVELVVKAGDPKARNVPANDWYRLRRSLEIIRSSGSPPSAFSIPYDSFREQIGSKSADQSTDGISDVNGLGESPTKELDYDFICIFLSSPRIDLYRSIDLRCEEMLMEPEGLLTEASWLLDIGLRPNMNSATRAIGYRQAMEYLQSRRLNGGRSSPEEFFAFLSEFQKASRNFAKRQMTWFRNELIYQWIDASQPFEKVVEFICNAYGDQNERAVPESLKMKKESTGRQESYELKSYRAKNKLFISDEDCSRVLSWIRRTQRN